MKSFEAISEQMQFRLAIAQRFERSDRFKHVVAIRARLFVALPDVMQTLGQREPPGILNVTAVDDVTKRPYLPPRFVFKLDAPHRFTVHGRHLLARPQISDRLVTR